MDARTSNVWTFTTDDLNNVDRMAYLWRILKSRGALKDDCESLVIPATKEFSADGYDKLFTNYADISSMISKYDRPYLGFPLTYPIA